MVGEGDVLDTLSGIYSGISGTNAPPAGVRFSLFNQKTYNITLATVGNIKFPTGANLILKLNQVAEFISNGTSVYLLTDLSVGKALSISSPTAATIASRAIAYVPGVSYYVVDTEAAAASDDLDSIIGGSAGDLIILRSANNARAVVVRDLGGGGNIQTGANRTLGDITDHITLINFNSTQWHMVAFADN